MKELSNNQYSLVKDSTLKSISKLKLATDSSSVSAPTLSAAVGGTIVGIVGFAFYGIINTNKYLNKTKSGKQAIKDTITNSTGLGLSAAVGTAVGSAVSSSSVVLVSPVILPLITGVTVTLAFKQLWNHHLFPEKNNKITTNASNNIVIKAS